MATEKTDFRSELVKTDKTNKTNFVSNNDFLRAIFGNSMNGERPVVVSFKGNPGNAPAYEWSGSPWQGCNLPGDANNYFSLATFKPDEAGKYRRIKSRYCALYAVMLDDVGNKVLIERLTLSPSWLLETSPGNCQAGYLLRIPLADGPLADRLMNSIVATGLCDPGATGPRTRLARLPVAVNGKYSPAFNCRMLEWAPELRYSVEELINGLQLNMMNQHRQTKKNSNSKKELSVSVWLPQPEENAVLVSLRDRGLYKNPLGNGKHEITCPWVQEHTGEIDGGTVYYEPDDLWPIGGFKCQHGHCSQRHINDLLRLLDIEPIRRFSSCVDALPCRVGGRIDAAMIIPALCFKKVHRVGIESKRDLLLPAGPEGSSREEIVIELGSIRKVNVHVFNGFNLCPVCS